MPDDAPETLSLHYLADERSLVILLAGGDIATLALHSPDGSVAPVRLALYNCHATDKHRSTSWGL